MAQSRKSTKRSARKSSSRSTTSSYTHIDRANGALLKSSDLDKKKPHISPVSGQATVEKLTDSERKAL